MLVTPVLVHPLDMCKTPPLPGNNIFEPGDVEFYLMGHLEGRRSEDYRTSVRTDFERQKKWCYVRRRVHYRPARRDLRLLPRLRLHESAADQPGSAGESNPACQRLAPMPPETVNLPKPQ